jgi:hypothetical protein
MSRINVTALLALATVALPSSAALAQAETTTVRTERELKLSIEVPAVPSAQCQAVAATSYHQRNTFARVASTIDTADCPAAVGEFKIAIRVRDESGEVKSLEFDETWRRSDAKSVVVERDYPIGENVELVNARVRGLTCTCSAAPAEDAKN